MSSLFFVYKTCYTQNNAIKAKAMKNSNKIKSMPICKKIESRSYTCTQIRHLTSNHIHVVIILDGFNLRCVLWELITAFCPCTETMFSWAYIPDRRLIYDNKSTLGRVSNPPLPPCIALYKWCFCKLRHKSAIIII